MAALRGRSDRAEANADPAIPWVRAQKGKENSDTVSVASKGMMGCARSKISPGRKAAEAESRASM